MDKPLLASQQVGNRLRGTAPSGPSVSAAARGPPGTVADMTGARGRRTSAAREDTDSAAGDHGGGQPGRPRRAARPASARQGPGRLAARGLPGVPRPDGRAARHRHLSAGRPAPAERDRLRSLGATPVCGLLGGRGPGAGLRAGYPDHALVGPLPRVRAAVASPARSWLQRPGQVLRGLRAHAGPGRSRRAGPAGRVLRARRPGGRGRGRRAAGRPRPGPGPERRQRGQRRAARAPAAGRGDRRRGTGGVAGELAQRLGDLLRGAADHDAGGLAAALRGQRPGRRGGVHCPVRDGGAGTARARGRQTARRGSGSRSGVGFGGGLPRGAAAVRILTR